MVLEKRFVLVRLTHFQSCGCIDSSIYFPMIKLHCQPSKQQIVLVKCDLCPTKNHFSKHNSKKQSLVFKRQHRDVDVFFTVRMVNSFKCHSLSFFDVPLRINGPHSIFELQQHKFKEESQEENKSTVSTRGNMHRISNKSEAQLRSVQRCETVHV